jgi:uncharacterized protein (DUF433 family)
MARATAYEFEQRTSEIADALAKGDSRQEIIKTFGAKWGLNVRQIDAYIAKAYTDFAIASESNREVMLGAAVAFYQHVKATLYKHGDLIGAMKAQTRLDKLWGLESPIEHIATVNVLGELAKYGLSPEAVLSELEGITNGVE